MKRFLKIALAIMFVPVFFVGFYFGRHSLSGREYNYSTDIIPDSTDSTPNFKPLTVEDIGVDSVSLLYWVLDGLNEHAVITPKKAEAAVEIGMFTDTTVSISDYDRTVILRSIDSLYISKVCKPIEKVIHIDLELSNRAPSLGVTIYKDGRSHSFEIFPADIIEHGKGYIFSRPCNELITTMVMIGNEAQYPYDGKIKREYGDPRNKLMERLAGYYYPEPVPISTQKQF